MRTPWLAVSFILLAGCYEAIDIRLDELGRLDGWKPDTADAHSVVAKEDPALKLTTNGKLWLQVHGRADRYRFREISVDGTTFRARTEDGVDVTIPLAEIERVRARHLDVGGTIAVSVFGALLTGAMIYAAATAPPCCDYNLGTVTVGH